MTIRISLGEGTGGLSGGDRQQIVSDLEAVAARAAARLELTDADITLVVAPPLTFAETGIGSATLSPTSSQLTLDPANPRFRDAERNARLGATLAHELHHQARYRLPAGGWTPERNGWSCLGAALLNEGLALSFEEEMGFPCAFTAIAVERDPLWNLAARAVAEFKSTSFDADAWFSGRTGDAEFPRYGGYSLGYALVRNWLLATETIPSEELALEVDEVLVAWRTGRLDV